MAGVEEPLHILIEEQRKVAFPEPTRVQDFRDYTAGRQGITLTADQKKILRGLLGKTFCDNVCRRIVSTVAARVRLDRMDVPDTAVEKFLKEVAVHNWLQSLANRVHYSAIRDGNHAVSLAWDNIAKKVVMQRELWWNGKSGVFIAYDENSQPTMAVKQWDAMVAIPGTSRMAYQTRRVVWEPHRIGRFVLKEGGWQWFTLDVQTDSAGNVIQEAELPGWQEWLDRDGKPLGIPCVHFARLEQPIDRYVTRYQVPDVYGVSVLDGGVLGIQDMVNDDHWNIAAAARMTAYQHYFVKGVDINQELDMMPGGLTHVEAADADMKAIPAGSLAELLNALQVHLQAAARSTNTPHHAIYGDWPSGEAIIQADRPLVDQAEALMDSFGPSWAAVAHRATQIANAFGGTNLNEDALITSIFRPADRNDLLTLATVAQAVSPYVSKQEVLRILRYPPDRIEQIMQEMEAEQGAFVGTLPGGVPATGKPTPAPIGKLATTGNVQNALGNADAQDVGN